MNRSLQLAVRKLAGGGVAQDMLVEQAQIDTGRMTATAIISTATIDRDTQIVHTPGIDLSRYKSNPVVLWDHGFGGMKFPIGTSVDPANKEAGLVIQRGDDWLAATCFFASTAEATELFELIHGGIIRATSIGLLPKASEWLRDGGSRVEVITSCELLEWSFVPVGANPDAIVQATTRKSWSPEVTAILKSMAPRATLLGKGTDFVKGSDAMTDVQKQEPAPTEQPAAQADAQASPATPDLPAGAQALARAHEALGAVSQMISDEAATIENPDAKDGLMAAAAAIDEVQTGVAGVYASTYPDAPALQDASTGADGASKSLVEFLATSPGQRFSAAGLPTLLRSAKAAPADRQAAMLERAAEHVQRLVAAAKSAADAKAPAGQPAVVSLKGLAQEFTGMAERLKALLPQT